MTVRSQDKTDSSARSVPVRLGVYIHIPFCRARCGYCDFDSTAGQESRLPAYLRALAAEINLYASDPRLREASADTVYFGGGTPSLLEPSQVLDVLKMLRSFIRVSPDAEITLEANPESVTLEKARGWRQAGMNRVSLGIQAFDDTLLQGLGRLHTVAQAQKAYEVLRRAGFDNVGIDLIYGLPGQTLGEWKTTLASGVSLGPDHLSLYALSVEEGTPLAAAGAVTDPDLQVEMYDWARVFLDERHFEQYEVSNFSRSGRSCRHNLLYWRGGDYLGWGAGAVGTLGHVRWRNHARLEAYETAVNRQERPVASEEILNERTRKFERLMLGLRLREGLEWSVEEDPLWRSHRDRLASEGRLEEISPGCWRIPDRYVSVTNQVLLPFV